MLGFATTPREESAAYIKDWLAEFHKEPTYLFDILTDVNRAARMISERLAVEQEPETPGAIPAEASGPGVLLHHEERNRRTRKGAVQVRGGVLRNAVPRDDLS